MPRASVIWLATRWLNSSGKGQKRFAGVIVSALFGTFLSAQQVLVQPSSYDTTFEGPALRFECVAELKRRGEEAFAESFRLKSIRERRLCLDQLLQALRPEPDFTAEDFRRALKRNTQGDYVLDSNRAMSARIGVNINVARGIAELAKQDRIDDSAVIRPLVECLNHPLLEVGQYCNRALMFLTRHTYGSRFFERGMGAPALTVANHQQVVADWRDLNRLVRHPIYDASLVSVCTAAIRAVAAELRSALPLSPGPAAYLGSTPSTATEISQGTWEEEIFRLDVGRHNTANWPTSEAVTRIAVLLIRPGVPRSGNNETLEHIVSEFQNADYREIFDALDLELRFSIGTSDQVVRRRSVRAVQRALNGLRAANAKVSR